MPKYKDYNKAVPIEWTIVSSSMTLVLIAVISPVPMMPQKSYAQGQRECSATGPHRCPLVVTVVNAVSCSPGLSDYGCPEREYMSTTVNYGAASESFPAEPSSATASHPCVGPMIYKTFGPLSPNTRFTIKTVMKPCCPLGEPDWETWMVWMPETAHIVQVPGDLANIPNCHNTFSSTCESTMPAYPVHLTVYYTQVLGDFLDFLDFLDIIDSNIATTTITGIKMGLL